MVRRQVFIGGRRVSDTKTSSTKIRSSKGGSRRSTPSVAWKKVGKSSFGTPIWEKTVGGQTQRIARSTRPSATQKGLSISRPSGGRGVSIGIPATVRLPSEAPKPRKPIKPTATYDPTRGGVVTSTGRFFPTKNRSFIPRGFAKGDVTFSLGGGRTETIRSGGKFVVLKDPKTGERISISTVPQPVQRTIFLSRKGPRDDPFSEKFQPDKLITTKITPGQAAKISTVVDRNIRQVLGRTTRPAPAAPTRLAGRAPRVSGPLVVTSINPLGLTRKELEKLFIRIYGPFRGPVELARRRFFGIRQ